MPRMYLALTQAATMQLAFPVLPSKDMAGLLPLRRWKFILPIIPRNGLLYGYISSANEFYIHELG